VATSYLFVKDRVWPSINYAPHVGQQSIHNSTARMRVASCGRRFGKSTVGGHELTAEALYTANNADELKRIGKQRRFWIVGPDYSDDDKEFRVVWYDLLRLGFPMDKPGSYYYAQQGNMHIEAFDGTFQVHAKSARNIDSLDGEGLAGVLLVEAAKLKPSVWTKYIRPALADEHGWALMTSTPEGKNWFYNAWQAGQDPNREQWDSWRMPAWANPVVYPGGAEDSEILEMRQDMSQELFNQEIAADFTEYVGRVFKDFDEELHVGDFDYNPNLPLYGATDYGWTNPFVWLGIQVDAFDNVYVIGEYRVDHRDINDIARDLKRIPWAYNAREFFPEPAGPTETAVLERALKMKPRKNTGGDKKWRLELIREHLKFDVVSAGHPVDKRQPKLFIDRKCYGLIQEMLDYRYPATKEESLKAVPEQPLDKDDHGPEALGRFFRGYFGAPGDSETGGRAKVKRARVS
jgi:hypothetical protein